MTSTALSRTLGPRKHRRPTLFDLEHTRALVHGIFDSDIHEARVESIANAVAGTVDAMMASVAAIGRAYAELAGISTKSGVKQVDRLLSNGGVVLDEVLGSWVRYVIGELPSVVVAIDWTDFDEDDHTTLCISLITTHGRATPLVWHTVKKSELRGKRTHHELSLVKKLHGWLPPSTRVELLGDRAFGYVELYALLAELGWDYTLRFRENIVVFEQDDDKLSLPASAYVPQNGRVRMLLRPRVTGERYEVPAVVLVKRKGMKEAWCLATSRVDDAASSVKTYSRRFTIEETFRDTKDITFGAGLRATHIRHAERRDRLLLLIAIAHTALTVLGAASEASGLDRTLKTNTVKHRTMSLLNQGLCWYRSMLRGTIRPEWQERLFTAYERLLSEHSFLGEILLFNRPPSAVK
jgi:Transposase DDE domain